MLIIDQLKRDEGLRLTPYTDTVGKLTIGYGRNLSDTGITKEEAETLLQTDVINASQVLKSVLPWTDTLDDARRGVLLNMTFNMGIHSLLGFTNTLMAIQQGNYEAAADEMLKSKWAEQVGPRAHRLSIQLRTGVWQ